MKKVVITETQLKKLVEQEVDTNDAVYHNTFSSAVQYARQKIEDKGLVIDEDDWWFQVNLGEGRPKPGKSTRMTLGITKDGKPQKKSLHIQVYNMGNDFKRPYELNYYIS